MASNQKMHVELVHLGLKKYKSEICHKTFGQAGAVKTHQSRFHVENRKKFDCHLCNYSYTNKWSLKMHLSLYDDQD